jgi:hypothetical protein
MSGADPTHQILDDIRRDLEDAADRILTLAFAGLDMMRGTVTDTATIEALFTGVLEASSFQDIVCQRLDRLEAILNGRTDDRPDSALLNGPAPAHAGLDQTAADLLFAPPDVLAAP